MSLRIDTIKYQGQPAQTRPPVIVNRGGVSIGRAMDNSIVLHDEAVSRRHARISFEGGRYYLIDESSNGTLIYNRDLLVRDETVELIDGDVLRIGDHELRVSISAEEIPASERYSSAAPLRGKTVPVSTGEEEIGKPLYPEARSAEPARGAALLVKELSIDDFFKDSDEEENILNDREDFPSTEPPAGSSESGSGGEAKVQEASSPLHQPEVESLRAYPQGESALEISRISDPIRQAPDEVYRELLNRFLKGTGVETSSFTDAEIPDLMERLGAVFRELVNGLWMVLRGRAEMKAEIRIAMTMVRPASNNPLKFSPTLEDAVKHLLKRDHSSFLEPVDAVHESFDDIMNHQLALNAGIQAALVEALDRLDPERFSEKNKDSSILHTKGKIWKAYCEAYPELKEEALEGIFGKAFVRAYEDQLEKMRIKKARS